MSFYEMEQQIACQQMNIDDLTRENAQLRAVIAEQKEAIEQLNDKQWELIGEKAPVLVSARKTITEQSAIIAEQKETIVTGVIAAAKAYETITEQFALIEKLGEALEHAQLNPTPFGHLAYYAEALDELAAWRKK